MREPLSPRARRARARRDDVRAPTARNALQRSRRAPLVAPAPPGKIFGIFFILFGLAKIFTIICDIGMSGIETVVSRILDAADDDPTDNKKPHGAKVAISCAMIIVCVFTGSIWFYVSVARGVARVRAAPARGRGGFSGRASTCEISRAVRRRRRRARVALRPRASSTTPTTTAAARPR